MNAVHPGFGRYVSRKELVDRVEQMNRDLRAGVALKTPTTGLAGSVDANETFLGRLRDYPGDSLDAIQASAATYEKRARVARTGAMAVGGAGILASFGALGLACHGYTTAGLGGLLAGAAVFFAINYGARKAVELSNRMLEKADGHGNFKQSLQAWTDFLGDERERQFEEVSKMSNAKLAADGIKATDDAVRINGIWIPRKQAATA
jgi:hypothetical protein